MGTGGAYGRAVIWALLHAPSAARRHGFWSRNGACTFRGVSSPPLAATPLSLITLGGIGISGLAAAETRALLNQPRRFAVLAFLVLSRQRVALSRDQLLAAFWPESSETQARNALRQTLSFLRSCLGQDAIVNGGVQSVSVSDRIQCDAVAFDALLRERRREEALQLYGGDLLPGFHARGASGFMRWLDERRGHYRQRAAKAAWDLSVDAEARADESGAAFWGKRALALSPFSESEVQRLLRLLTRLGDFAGALRAYHGLQGTLRTEFGLEPSAETTRLAAEARRQLSEAVAPQATGLGTRRSSPDRRREERRQRILPIDGPERRVTDDRRKDQRRSGLDRRALRDLE